MVDTSLFNCKGHAEKAFEVIRKCHENMAEKCDRVVTTVRIDAYKGKTGTLKSKVASVEEKLGHIIRK